MTDHRTLQKLLERENNERMEKVCRDALNEINRRVETFDRKYGIDAALSDAKVFEYKRMTMLAQAINEVLRTIAPGLAPIVKSTVEKAYMTGYYWNAFIADMTVPFELNFVGVNVPLLRASVSRRIAGYTLSDRLSTERLARLFSERDIIAKAQLLGYGEAKTAKALIKENIRSGVNQTYAQAACIARTESCRNATEAANQATSNIMDEHDLDIRNVWLSGHDERTRFSHRELDGEVANTWSDRYRMYCFSHNGMISPGPGRWGNGKMDISCRCSLKQKILGYEEFECRSVETYYEWLDRIRDDPRYSETVAVIFGREAIAA